MDCLYDKIVTRVYLADAHVDERAALRLLLLDRKMEVVGEAVDWPMACPNAIVVVLISPLDARQQAAISAGADAFISKGETPERVAERLQAAAARVLSSFQNGENP